jgi:hypothetical protein
LAKADAVAKTGLVPSLDEPPILPSGPARIATPLIRTTHERCLQDHMVYCRWKLPAVARVPSVHYFFSDPLGRDRSLSDTNMFMAGYLPLPTEQLVQRILFLFSPQMLDADRDLLMSRYSYRLEVGNKIKHQGPLVRFPLVGDLGSVVNQNKFRGNRQSSEGWPVWPAIGPPFCVELQELVLIPAGMYFTVFLSGESFDLASVQEGGTGLDLICGLDGMGCFAVQ